MLDLFRISSNSGLMGNAPMSYDRMESELIKSPLSRSEELEISRDGGKTWEKIGKELPERKAFQPRRKMTYRT